MMKTFVLVMVAAIVTLGLIQPIKTNCIDVGWGGCSDMGCFQSGGTCINYGRPPRNYCRCMKRRWWLVLTYILREILLHMLSNLSAVKLDLNHHLNIDESMLS